MSLLLVAILVLNFIIKLRFPTKKSNGPQHRCQMFRALSGLFSPNLIHQSSCKMGLVLACVVRTLHDDWSIRLGENRPDRVLEHLAAMLWSGSVRKLQCLSYIGPLTALLEEPPFRKCDTLSSIKVHFCISHESEFDSIMTLLLRTSSHDVTLLGTFGCLP